MLLLVVLRYSEGGCVTSPTNAPVAATNSWMLTRNLAEGALVSSLNRGVSSASRCGSVLEIDISSSEAHHWVRELGDEVRHQQRDRRAVLEAHGRHCVELESRHVLRSLGVRHSKVVLLPGQWRVLEASHETKDVVRKDLGRVLHEHEVVARVEPVFAARVLARRVLGARTTRRPQATSTMSHSMLQRWR